MINWRVRFKNKTFLFGFFGEIVAFAYVLCSMFDIVPAVTENAVMGFVVAAVNILVMLGIVQDPTTEGVADSNQALTYTEPKSN